MKLKLSGKRNKFISEYPKYISMYWPLHNVFMLDLRIQSEPALNFTQIGLQP